MTKVVSLWPKPMNISLYVEFLKEDEQWSCFQFKSGFENSFVLLKPRMEVLRRCNLHKQEFKEVILLVFFKSNLHTQISFGVDLCIRYSPNPNLLWVGNLVENKKEEESIRIKQLTNTYNKASYTYIQETQQHSYVHHATHFSSTIFVTNTIEGT